MKLACSIFLLVSSAFAQSDGILTSASRSVTVTADQADFAIVATTSLDVTSDQVAQILQTAGLQNLTLTASAIVPVNSFPIVNPQLTVAPLLTAQAIYQFSFSVTAAAMKDTAKKVEALRVNLPATLQSLQYSANAVASQTAVDAARQTVLPLLLADAQKKAQSLAVAAGLKLGAIKAVSESSFGTPNAYSLVSSVISSGYASSTTTGAGGTQYTFSAVVTFALGQ